MMNVTVVQSRVLPYRVPFFNALAVHNDWRVRVIHSGKDVPAQEREWEQEVVGAHSLGAFRIQAFLSSRLRNQDANVVMFDLHWPTAIVLALRVQRMVPLVWWGHGLGRRPIARAVRRVLARRGDAVVVYGQVGRERMIEAGVPEDKVHVAPNTMWVDGARDTSGSPKSHFLFVGRLQRRKRLPDLIRAYASIQNETPLDLVLVGEGATRDELEELAHAEGVSGRLHMCGAVYDGSELTSLFEKAVAYVSPACVGLGVLHAFSYGVPVVTSSAGPHGPEVEWVHDRRSGIFSDGTVEDLACLLRELARDPILARELGRNAFHTYAGPANPREMLKGFSRAVTSAVAQHEA